MPEFWQEVLNAVNAILLEMPYHGLLLNERYLHHFFSHRIQCAAPNPLDLLDAAHLVRLHPEWPTYKEGTEITFGKYRKRAGIYMPVDEWPGPGFIDFALGSYRNPEIAVEFKLFHNKWNGEGVSFDYMKLLDRRNPFKAVVSAVVILRPRRVAIAGWRADLERAMNAAYQAAVQRLGNGPFGPAADRLQRFIVTEIAPHERRHWFSGELHAAFAARGDTPPLPE